MDGIDGTNFGNLPSFSMDDPLGSGNFGDYDWGSSNGAFDTSNMDPSIFDQFVDPLNPDPANMYFDGFDAAGNSVYNYNGTTGNPGGPTTVSEVVVTASRSNSSGLVLFGGLDGTAASGPLGATAGGGLYWVFGTSDFGVYRTTGQTAGEIATLGANIGYSPSLSTLNGQSIAVSVADGLGGRGSVGGSANGSGLGGSVGVAVGEGAGVSLTNTTTTRLSGVDFSKSYVVGPNSNIYQP